MQGLNGTPRRMAARSGSTACCACPAASWPTMPRRRCSDPAWRFQVAWPVAQPWLPIGHTAAGTRVRCRAQRARHAQVSRCNKPPCGL